MTEEKKENAMEEDLFVNDFIHYIKIPIKNAKTNIVTEYEFGLKEISGYEEDKISKLAVKKDKRTGELELHTEEANIKYLQMCIVKAPFNVTIENIKKLTSKVRKKLLEKAKEINEVTNDVEKKSDGLSEDTN
jgi:hypothetical protein